MTSMLSVRKFGSFRFTSVHIKESTRIFNISLIHYISVPFFISVLGG